MRKSEYSLSTENGRRAGVRLTCKIKRRLLYQLWRTGKGYVTERL
jgi:hypothetical protein